MHSIFRLQITPDSFLTVSSTLPTCRKISASNQLSEKDFNVHVLTAIVILEINDMEQHLHHIQCEIWWQRRNYKPQYDIWRGKISVKNHVCPGWPLSSHTDKIQSWPGAVYTCFEITKMLKASKSNAGFTDFVSQQCTNSLELSEWLFF